VAALKSFRRRPGETPGRFPVAPRCEPGNSAGRAGFCYKPQTPQYPRPRRPAALRRYRFLLAISQLAPETCRLGHPRSKGRRININTKLGYINPTVTNYPVAIGVTHVTRSCLPTFATSTSQPVTRPEPRNAWGGTHPQTRPRGLNPIQKQRPQKSGDA
jgi:hypothetical protein